MSTFGFTPGGAGDQDGSTNSAHPEMINLQLLRESARTALAAQSVVPVGTEDAARMRAALDIAHTWLDEATLFPSNSQPSDAAWSRRDWLDASMVGWQKLVEPLAQAMASALSKLVEGMNFGEGEGVDVPLPDQVSPAFHQIMGGFPMSSAGILPMMRSFMGTLIGQQLGQSAGGLATRLTGANDLALPLFAKSESHLIPQNVAAWGEGLEIPASEIEIFLALREASATRLFAHTPWLTSYIQGLIASYGKGITIDVDAIQHQAMRAIDSGELDIENPDSISLAITSGMFMPEQSPEQVKALEKLEMALALIEGWIDHVSFAAAGDRLPSLIALQESARRARATNSPTQELFKTLLGLEVSPRRARESSHFWSELNRIGGVSIRDQRWEDAALLPSAAEINDPAAFLNSTTVPDDLSGLI